MFSESFRQRRCVIPADGFYEWKTVNKKKVPVHFHLKDNKLFGFAGVWDVWNSPNGKVFTVAIITTTPNELCSTLHDRMPVILSPEDEAKWLDPSIQDPTTLTSLLKSYPAQEMEAVQVNPALNKPSYEGADCLTPS